MARSLERRLEKLIEGVAGRMFSGRLHPTELAGKLAREADFARFTHVSGPATANLFAISLHPRDLTVDPTELGQILTDELSAYVIEEGLRIAGPIEVRVGISDEAAAGHVQCHVEVVPGPGETWAQLVSEDSSHDVSRNRCLIGRAEEADIRLRHDDISRHQAVIFREHGQSWIIDMGSANGTKVDGQSLATDPVTITTGTVLTLASRTFRIAID